MRQLLMAILNAFDSEKSGDRIAEMAETVFLCHNRADTEPVQELARRLKAEGVGVWLDTWNLIPGERFAPKIQDALEQCSAVAVFLGPLGRSPYQEEELESAINDRGIRGLRVIPVLLPKTPHDLVTGFLKNRTWVEFKDSLGEPEPFHLLLCGIRGIAPGDGAPVASGPSPSGGDGLCPYRGLAPFGVNDWEFFFGREKVTEDAVATVESIVQDSPFGRCLFIVGASGSGKSSMDSTVA